MTATESRLEHLYADFAEAHLSPLWTQLGDLMPAAPTSQAVPHVWKWSALYPLAELAGDLVPVGRGGERRAIALANPGLGGLPFATPTLWAAIQYLGPDETAPEHRHSQNAFRFVVDGEGVWTVVDGDPVAMRRGDLLLTAGWQFHGHHNPSGRPMAWIDGLDIPFVHYTDTGFFEFGPAAVTDRTTPPTSRSERLWAHPGLSPLVRHHDTMTSPLAAYRWEHTDAALRAQLDLQDEGHPGALTPGHAGVRYSNPATGGDVLPTIRAEFHRVRAGIQTTPRRDVGSCVYQVFNGTGTFDLGETQHPVAKGDLVVVPSWTPWRVSADDELDLFSFSDAPIVERLGLNRGLAVQGAQLP
ncbi:cupin domain-containing protein [Mycolicibacterium sphagni]|uniref:cupin domain-containing protein n=1 Tax=Mycolicibacterium sphagni TaxID=1786 RepID=UPI0021F35DF1|nr:cupin domain-containing protein [Mycolicibacterium sphagni]MCV7177047.1 cupin domain-containing protein [Mycolicibacterium sphagni]